MADAALSGTSVLVTRPRAQAADIVKTIESRGGTAIIFPVIEIIPRDASTEAAALADPDISIFVSSNAVSHGKQYASDSKVAAIGPATTAALLAADVDVNIRPSDGFDSESLLAEEGLADVAGKRIRIIRGTAGRELLADTLRERGAIVDYLAVYERVLPDIQAEELARLEAVWLSGGINAITLMSVQTWDNLLRVLPQSLKTELHNVLLVTPAKRVIKEALHYFPDASTALASGTGAAEMVEAIIAHQSTDSAQTL